MTVDNADGLQVAVYDGGTHEAHAAPVQVGRYAVREGRGGQARLPERGTVSKLPDIVVERPRLGLYLHEDAGIGDGRTYLEPVAYYRGVLAQSFYPCLVVLGYLAVVEPVKGEPERIALVEYAGPLEPCLGRLQEQQLEQLSVVVYSHAPFVVVVVYIALVAATAPSAPRATVGYKCRFFFHAQYY